ncbi:MAG: hypothetical protein K0R82_2281 [Flavipsychrobacter sp.]|jgi:hypothetical protein|nr:hypothetical protein [Flavipsychrobacter sp.]
MLRLFVERLFGIETAAEVLAEVGELLEDPCCRAIDLSSPAVYSIFGRDCAPGECVRNAATTPETGAVQYCRI